MSMLPHHQRIFLQIGHVIERRLGPELEQQPADVRVEKTFCDVVRVFLVIDMFMVAPMLACPHQNRILESARAKNHGEEADRQFCMESRMREKPMVAECDAE